MKKYNLIWYSEGQPKETLASNVDFPIAKAKENRLRATTHTTGKFIIKPVEENSYNFAEEILVRSSFITKFIYYKKKLHLDVEMKDGHRYRYYDISLNKFTRLKAASSQGQYYATKIRGKYPMRRLTQTESNQLTLEFN